MVAYSQVHISLCPDVLRPAVCILMKFWLFHFISADQLDFRWLILEILVSTWNNLLPHCTVMYISFPF
jgi:hypothetical protein